MGLDVFIDVTAGDPRHRAVEEAIAKWLLPEHLGAAADRVTIVTRRGNGVSGPQSPSNWRVAASDTPILEFNGAMEIAAIENRALLVVFGTPDVGVEAVGALQESLEQDPMFGFAVPRVSCMDRCCIARLTRSGVGPTEWLPRSVLGEIPEHELLLETVMPCVLMAPRIAGNFGPLDSGFESLPAALLDCMAAARRCGFRTVSCNRAVVAIGVACDAATLEPVPGLPGNDAKRIQRTVPDLARSWEQSGAGSAINFEELYTTVPRGDSREGRSLVIDIRNVAPVHNGTTHSILGLVGALRETTRDWSVSLLATEQGAAFHALAGRFGDWPVYTALPQRSFTVAFRPSQPWHLRELVDLHRVSLLTVCLLLDTIAWDVAYCAPPGLEAVWQFLATHADGLLYDSEFTRRRFATRFPAGADVPGAVVHFSFDPADYLNGTPASGAPRDGHILVVGNHLDHKDVRQTARTLATGFPYRRIEVLGPADPASPLVSAHPSGTLADSAIAQLYANASCVVYPSFYEGFGFPILTALAHGRTVFVRRSALVAELAPHCHGQGTLVPFDRREELIDLIGRLTDGERLEGLPIADPRQARPRGWRDVARETNQFLSCVIDERLPGRWRERDRAIAQMTSYRT